MRCIPCTSCFVTLKLLIRLLLHRPDDALAEYVAIYTAAPASAWGRLVALHLERV